MISPAHLTVAARRRGSTLLIFTLLMVFAVAAVAGLAYYLSRPEVDQSAGVLTAEVERTDFVNDVVESGEVESSESVEVRCEVKSRNGAGTTILDVVREGSQVRGPHTNELGEEIPGDVIVTLDASGLELEMQQEAIILNNKISLRDQALNVLISSISALKEYSGQEGFAARYSEELTAKLGDDAEEVLAAIQTAKAGETTKGTFHVEEQTFQGELFLAEENFRKAQQYFRYSESLAAQGYVTELQLKSDEFAVEKARKDRDAAQTKLDVLRIHTRRKTEKALAGEIYNALSVYRAEKSSVNLQEERVADIAAQIEKCIIRAPQDGQVVYANERDRRGNADFVVEAGATLRERQAIIRLPNSDKMQVEAKVSESKISLIKEGMKATIDIDAFEGMTLDGVVRRVNQYPEPTSWFSSTVKEYVTKVEILNPPAELKSGLTAKVRVHAQHIPSAQQVPIQAIYRHQGKFYCFVKDGRTWRVQPVTLGASNEKQVVIEAGLTDTDVVAMDPASIVDDVELPAAPAIDEESGEEMLAKGEAALSAKYEVVKRHDGAKPPAGGGAAAGKSPSDAGRRDPATMIAEMFTRSDKNKDGKLSEDELPERFRGNFSTTDSNSDGGIDQAEMTAAMAKFRQNRAGGAAE